jgi:hypothetical protein
VLLLSAGVSVAHLASAETGHKKHDADHAAHAKGKLVSVTEKDAAWLAKAR